MNGNGGWSYLIAIAALLGFAGVIAGAFGAHGLADGISAEGRDIFDTAVRFQMYHALAALAVTQIAKRGKGLFAAIAGWSFIAGIILFSGSLYLRVLTDTAWLGAVTPFGGIAFLVGWLMLAFAALLERRFF